MLVKVVSVNREDVPNKNGKGTYGKLTVAYRNDQGKLAEKPLLSFTNPAVFKAFESANPGDEINVKSEKVGDYWNWTGLLTGEESTSQPNTGSGSATATRATGGTYETKEERALKQRYIVKQSSISAAVAILTVGAKSAPSTKDIIALADEFVDYVFADDTKKLTADFATDNDDVPY